MKYLCLLIFITVLSHALYAQDYPSQSIDIQSLADNYFGDDSDVNQEERYEYLAQLRVQPRDLNTITAEDLRELELLNQSQVEQLILYRNNNGPFISVYELQAIPEFDLATLRRIAPFVTVLDPAQQINRSTWKRILEEGNHYILLRYARALANKEGFSSVEDSTRFLGSPDKLCVRLRSSRPGDFSMGFNFEKDEGEPIRWRPQQNMYGFDYLSFHLQLINKRHIRNLIIGDFQAQFGQGLLIGGGFGMGKGGETVSGIRRCNIGLMPYTSLNENGAFRGIGSTIQVKRNMAVTIFQSFNRRDAKTADTFSSLQTTGLHRNYHEIAMKHQVHEQNSGIVLQYLNRAFESGLIFHRMQYNKPLQRQSTLYNQFAFDGQSLMNTGFYLNYNFQNVSFFSEYGQSINAGKGMVAGILCSLHPTFDFSFSIRHYDRDFYSPYGNALSENTNAQNEHGVYWGWKYRMNRRISVSGYADLFVFPWIKFRNYKPSDGHEWLSRLEYTPSRKTKLTIQFRQETKTRNASEGVTYKIFPTQKHNFVAAADFGIGQPLRAKTRMQWSSFRNDNTRTQGITVMQDVGYAWRKLEVTAHYALFDTDDFDNRQYVYERDVWLAYSLPAYYGTGVRKCIMVEYKLNRQWSCWFRYAQTRYIDRSESGSGQDATIGNYLRDIKIQVLFKF